MKIGVALVTAILLVVGLVAAAPAEVVGRLTQVEGQVDLLKGGKLPATPAKLEDGVEPGDVLRTKSLSKAQVTFIDNTVITISPESRIAIEEYMFDPAKGKRSAVLQLFKGMALAVVSKIFKVEQPDFVVKTHTAIMGVRGTEVGIRLGPNDSTFLNFQGLTRVANIFPEVSGDLFRKAAKVAYSFGNAFVDLQDHQGTTVYGGFPPTLPFTITDQDRQQFMRQLSGNVLGRSGGGSNPVFSGSASGGAGGGGSGNPSTSGVLSEPLPTSLTGNTGVNPNAIIAAGVVIPPQIVPPTPSPNPTQNINFTESWTGGAAFSVLSPTVANWYNTSVGSGVSTATTLFPYGFTVSNFLAQATLTTVGVTWQPGFTGTYNVTATGILSGPATGILTGTMTMVISVVNDITFTLSGPITYNAGTMTYTFAYNSQQSNTNIFNYLGGDPQGTVNTGTWTQVALQEMLAQAAGRLLSQAGSAASPLTVTAVAPVAGRTVSPALFSVSPVPAITTAFKTIASGSTVTPPGGVPSPSPLRR